jgi:stearoyl-CoA desaturase (Delta-9 desaturase)
VLFDHALVGLFLGTSLLVLLLGPLYGSIAAAFHAVMYLSANAAVNAIGHHFGRRPYGNTATNLQWLALITGGEGLHNNHHAAPTSARLAHVRGQIDPGWWVISTFKALRLASVRLDHLVLARRRTTPHPAGGR